MFDERANQRTTPPEVSHWAKLFPPLLETFCVKHFVCPIVLSWPNLASTEGIFCCCVWLNSIRPSFAESKGIFFRNKGANVEQSFDKKTATIQVTSCESIGWVLSLSFEEFINFHFTTTSLINHLHYLIIKQWCSQCARPLTLPESQGFDLSILFVCSKIVIANVKVMSVIVVRMAVSIRLYGNFFSLVFWNLLASMAAFGR